MLGENIKFLRTSKNMYQQDLADALSVSKSTIAMWETNKRIPDAPTLLKIANYFNVTVDLLLSNTAVQSTDKPHIIELRAVDELPDGSVDTVERSYTPSDDDIKFALFDGSEGVSDEMYDEVKRFAKYIKEQKEKK